MTRRLIFDLSFYRTIYQIRQTRETGTFYPLIRKAEFKQQSFQRASSEQYNSITVEQAENPSVSLKDFILSLMKQSFSTSQSGFKELK